MTIRRCHTLCAVLTAAAVASAGSSALAIPSVQTTDAAVVVRGGDYELRLSKTAGVFDLLVSSGGKGELASVMRPGGEHGWYGYELNGTGGRNTQGIRPVISVLKHARGVTVSVRCLLDPQAGISHLAQYDCLDDCVIVCSRYEGPVPSAGVALARTGPKLDVDITRLDHYLFHDESGGRHAGELTGETRDFYVGARPWGGTEAAKEFDPKRPYQMLYNPATGAKLAVVYPFVDDIWRGQSRFLQLYHDGGNYWYTGTGSTSAFGRDFVVCLYTDDTPDESRLDGRIPALLAEAREAVQQGDIMATIKRRPGVKDGTLYLLSYDHSVGYPKIQDETRKSVALLDQDPDLRMGLQAEGFTWDWLAEHDPAFVAEAKAWISKYRGRWLPGGGSYGQPYFTFISEESCIRQMLYGTRAIKQRLGYDNTIYIHSEHETMPQMPQILAGMGYRGAFFRTHMGYGGDGPSRDADWVRWIGPDGSAIPAVPAYTGREHTWGNEWLIIDYKPGIEWYKGPACTWDDMEDFKTEMLSRGVTAPIVSRCEDWYTRPSRPLLEDVRAHPAPQTRWVTAEDYFDVLEHSGKRPVDMPCGPNDFQPRQPWGYAGNRTWTGPRMAASAALTAEALAAASILSGFNWTAERQARLDDDWKNVLIAEHHDSLICAIYNEGRDFTEPSLRLSQELSREAARYLTSTIDMRGPGAFVFNTTSHPRTEAVRLPDTPGVAQVTDVDGKPVPCQRDGQYLWFLARDVPPLGYAAFRLVPGESAPAAVPPAQRTLTSDRFSVAFGEHGGLTQLRDVATGRDLLGAGVTGALKGLVNTSQAQSQGAVALTLNGPCIWQAKETGTVGPIGYEMTYTLLAGSPRVDLHIRLQIPKGTRIACPGDSGTPDSRRGEGHFFDNANKLRYVLNTSLDDNARAVRHQPLIIAEMPASAGGPVAAETVDANLWASLESKGFGLAIANRGSMGLRRVGADLEPILAYSGEYVWGDNFLEGTYDYDFALIPYVGASGRGAAHRAAVEFDSPLLATAFEGGGGKLPMRRRLADIGRCPDAVTALSLFPQDGHVFLRLCNMSATPTRTALPPSRVADLALRLAEPVSGPVELKPWRAQTYELLRQSAR